MERVDLREQVDAIFADSDQHVHAILSRILAVALDCEANASENTPPEQHSAALAAFLCQDAKLDE